MVAIAYMSLRPTVEGVHVNYAKQVFNNFLHIPTYGLLAYFILHCCYSLKIKTYFLAAMLTIVYGVFIEFCQSFIPGRFSSLTDIFLNTIGVILSLGCIYYFNAIRNTQYAIRD